MSFRRIESAAPAAGASRQKSGRQDERGYALVALIALMTIMMFFATAAAPTIRQQTMREREIEAIFRGEEVAEAIRRYAQANNGQLPVSMNQLLEGVPRGTKKVQVLRPVAAKDPLSESGEWRLVRLNDPALLKFQVAVTLYAGGKEPVTRDPFIQRYKGTIKSIVNIESEEDAKPGEGEESAGGEDTSINSTGPFIGVTSRNRSKSVITYYGIDRHDRWVFTPLFR